MKIFVLSDTHGSLYNAYPIIDNIKTEISAIVHLGDYIEDAEKLRIKYPDIPLYNVAGNCDFPSQLETEKTISLAGKKIFITHGHKYHVNSSYARLSYAAEEQNADIALYGHTHSALIVRVGGLIIMNPGSLSSPRGTHICSYGIITISENGLVTPCVMGIYENCIKAMNVEL